MRCFISYISRKAKGGITRRETSLTTDSLHIGRSTESDIHLPDFRVSLHHADINGRDGRFFIEPSGAGIRIDGAPVTTERAPLGKVVRVGPYDIHVVDPPPDTDLALTVELVRPLGDDLGRLQARSVTTLATAGLSKRFMSWSLFGLIALLFLALPVTAFYMDPLREALKVSPITADQAWKSGAFARAHEFFASDCKACHQQAFQTVRDKACVTCHQQTYAHADPDYQPVMELNETRCASCHKEHNGANALVRNDQGLCADCHATLAQSGVSTELENAGDFTRQHPEFLPTLYVLREDGQRSFDTERVALDASPPPEERSNLAFTHTEHLDPEGIDSPEGSVVMKCADCHTPDPGGPGMQPIRMTQHCQKCHRLEFEPEFPQRQVPHGLLDQVLYTLYEHYGDIALKGGYPDALAPKVVQQRRRPGQKLTTRERKVALQWAQDKTFEVGEDLFEGRVCATCHEVTRLRSEYPPKWDIRPVKIADRWLPKGHFPHDHHKTVDCGDCHDAADSGTSEDILIPGIDNCRQCHGGVEARNRIPSTCIDCHGFHVDTRFLLGDRQDLPAQDGVSGTAARVRDRREAQ